MQIVIEMPEELYNDIKTHPLFSSDMPAIERAIKNGTLLPKGHGDLKDADALWDEYHANDYDFYEALDDAPTIIEKDGAE